MASLPGLFAYWKLTETSGTVADNAQGNAALDGTFTSTPTLAAAAFPVGASVPTFDGATSRVVIPATAFHDAMDWSKGWYLGWGRPTASTLTDDTRRTWIQAHRNSEEQIRIRQHTGDYIYDVSMIFGGDSVSFLWSKGRVNWTLLALVWDIASDYVRLFVDGVMVEEATGLTAPGGNPQDAAHAVIGWANDAFIGGLGHHAFGAGQALTETQINDVYEAAIPNTSEITFAGDSKSTDDNRWSQVILDDLQLATGSIWRERMGRVAAGGLAADTLRQRVQARIPTVIGDPEYVLINVGANDVIGAVVEADWKADLVDIIDQYIAHTAAEIYIAYPWRRTYGAECAAMKTWIDAVIALYGSRVNAGHDENVWMEGGDDGVTMTADGVHYSVVGQTEMVSQWLTILGY